MLEHLYSSDVNARLTIKSLRTKNLSFSPHPIMHHHLLLPLLPPLFHFLQI